MGLERLLPACIKHPLEELVRWPGRLKHRRSLEQRPFTLAAGGPRINYAGKEPKPGQIVHGGRVKLLGLAERFPHCETEFNAIYLVSSALPLHVIEFVRWARARGVKLIWNQNGVAFPAWAGDSTRAVNRPLAELLRMADFVVYQSEFCRQSADRQLGPASCPSTVLFNPVDLSRFQPGQRSLETWELLAAGTHNQSFRVLGAIETLRLLRAAGHPARLTIAGELRWAGAQRDVRAAIEAAGLADHVTLKPPFTQAEALEMLQSAHVLLHAKYADPCPTMVIEAMACGVPVVGSRTGGMPELVGSEGGALIDVPFSYDRASFPTPEQMAAAVTEIMQAWPEKSRQARARAERLFGREQWLEEHARIFDACLAR
ncbi:MAG: glycosyltransferase family 4 protein [Chthoniobacteraceae bacterium]